MESTSVPLHMANGCIAISFCSVFKVPWGSTPLWPHHNTEKPVNRGKKVASRIFLIFMRYLFQEGFSGPALTNPEGYATIVSQVNSCDWRSVFACWTTS
jgi:hypothetical protein